MENKEIIQKIKSCQTVEELKAVAKEIGYELSDDEAMDYLEKCPKLGELADDELSNVTGGCTWWRKGRAYSGIDPHYLIVTRGNTCIYYRDSMTKPAYKVRIHQGHCPACHFSDYDKYPPAYCTYRTYDQDPLNPKK